MEREKNKGDITKLKKKYSNNYKYAVFYSNGGDAMGGKVWKHFTILL